MPLPTPKKGQDKKDFVNICMDNLKMVKEFPDDEQRAAVCYSQWEKSSANVEIQDGSYVIDFSDEILAEKEKKTLNKPFRTPKGPKKFSVYVKNEKGNVVKVNFGDPNMEIKRDDPNRRKNFRARHNCDNPGPKTKARYWSCRQWRGGKKVEASIQSTVDNEYEWDGETIFNHDELLAMNPELASVTEEVTEKDDCGCEECSCEEANTSESALTEKQNYASLWENIRKKKERIKSGSGEKMRKKGDKGAPTAEQIKKAQKKAKDYGKVTANYEMSLEEYDEVMSGEELDLEDSAAKRSGPKSAAQTPAKPSERKKGSSKNPKGSAGKGGGSITFSEKVLTSLKNKVKEHNAKHSKKVTLGQLKKVYRRGAGAFSQSHRPNMSRGGWAMARVNMFLKMKRGGKVKDSYRKADGDI
tara:strand:+ start:1829 stop:3070 length:1242 start_codon:yes stop_codon:yes gene_type:complete